MASPIPDQIISSLDSFKASVFAGDERARIRAVGAALRLYGRLQTNMERYSVLIGLPYLWGTIQTFHELGLLEAWWVTAGSEKSLNEIVELANTEVDAGLIRRLLRILTTSDIVDETGVDRYRATQFAAFLALDNGVQVQAWTDHYQYGNLPGYLKARGYKEPDNPKDTVYSDSVPDKTDFWTRMTANPAYQASFSGGMHALTCSKLPWTTFFDTQSVLVDAATDAMAPILVDIGGNTGTDLALFLDKHPDVPDGTLIVQDRGEALAHFQVSGSKVRTMAHDFFTPQPVAGSRAYFFHAIFHDWAHAEAVKILKALVPAMKKGYSRVLICDVVLPPQQASAMQAVMDMAMLWILAARERTLEEWEAVLTEAGLRIVKLWDDPRGYETLIEAETA